MARQDRDIEEHLSVGTPVAFHSNPFRKDAPRYSTCIRGWRKPVYVILDRPKVDGRFVVMAENQPCIIRFISQGFACAFDTIILDWDTRRHNAYFRVEWPQDFKRVTFRKHERISIRLQCAVRSAQGTVEATINDLSIGGCGLQGDIETTPGEEIALSFDLGDGFRVENVATVVRNVRPLGGQTLVGCQFLPGQDVVESDIAFFVTTKLGRVDMQSGGGPRVLIIDDNANAAAVLRKAFENRGYEVFTASGAVDGFSRLRLTPPSVMLVNQELNDLKGLDVLSAVRHARGFDRLPLFIYGGNAPDLEARALEAGATGFFAAGATMRSVVDAVVAHGARESQPAEVDESDDLLVEDS